MNVINFPTPTFRTGSPTLPSICRRSPPPKGRRHEGRCLAKPATAVLLRRVRGARLTSSALITLNDVRLSIHPQPPPGPGSR